ncbi:hypothetical protein [Natrinema longum]|uniref:Uncharacterized protein n=1 Tax=Natrinema longum TaxID=370324 RepID=A0A8A2UC29_9EURY|nr:hypothetical protein [Natrinema longum]MBZ6495800.1 hypothetical protein [Natrinema longum]QSW86256.1 hypothetical protein J0X27_05400 [Natrinema longum]
MSFKDFASTIDHVFDRFEVVGNPLSDYDRPLDELFEDPTVVIRWSADPREQIPDISPVLKLAAQEDMLLVDRTLEYNEGDESLSETPQLSESLEFEHRP